jgi:hypothetical protein
VRNGDIVPPGFSAIDLRVSSFVRVANTRTTTAAIGGSTAIGIIVGVASLVEGNVSDGLIQLTCPGVLTRNVTTGFIAFNATNGPCAHHTNAGQKLLD